ncbi:GNAT family N-acetyltransferase [Paenarthrobacter aurescens]|nr:GNAT family N-acetyltransferase [Paenarthrobacter aurescens]MDO6145152.1 GNAT family N-acetyltransferase [Paenarthrobacter aurescens]MDO6148997.1 GNAT family N-acetyltransferase [Paenarthrobacter aurescens]MDO6160243.1 GNAT family N-acetyltransferase [Paenarthrobacter aurescens]MDO6164102.1 GNAT family N-acetyltransferase [Paenarthrobacter aurescens]
MEHIAVVQNGQDPSRTTAWREHITDAEYNGRQQHHRLVPMSVDFVLRPTVATDAAWIAELRAVVMRPDLERLQRFDPVRVRERFLNGFQPEHTYIIHSDGVDAGVIAVRPEPDSRWIEHFYVAPAHQGKGLGSAVLRHVMSASVDERPFRLNVLQGSPARNLYERHGFVVESEDPVDVFMMAPANPLTTAH